MARKKWDVVRYEWAEGHGKNRFQFHPPRDAAVIEHDDDSGTRTPRFDALKAQLDAKLGHEFGGGYYRYSRNFEVIATVKTRKAARALADLYSEVYDIYNDAPLQPSRYHGIRERAGLADFAAVADPNNRDAVRRAGKSLAAKLDDWGGNYGYAPLGVVEAAVAA
ncbi:hypothetical protein [Gordonia alkaliphila]|uniref:DUF3800 domain-containing protein n=1 Tax=Gordonia alkaliphila TaxID=1053547 RepID=A0ABP8Z4L4_9ACTN